MFHQELSFRVASVYRLKKRKKIQIRMQHEDVRAILKMWQPKDNIFIPGNLRQVKYIMKIIPQHTKFAK